MNELKRSVVYRYPKGHIHFRTSTVAELVEFLQQFPADMPVLAEWEGQLKGFGYTSVDDVEGKQTLLIDVEREVTKEDN